MEFFTFTFLELFTKMKYIATNKPLQVFRCPNSHSVVFESLEDANLYRFVTGIKRTGQGSGS